MNSLQRSFRDWLGLKIASSTVDGTIIYLSPWCGAMLKAEHVNGWLLGPLVMELGLLKPTTKLNLVWLLGKMTQDPVSEYSWSLSQCLLQPACGQIFCGSPQRQLQRRKHVENATGPVAFCWRAGLHKYILLTLICLFIPGPYFHDAWLLA